VRDGRDQDDAGQQGNQDLADCGGECGPVSGGGPAARADAELARREARAR